MAINDSCSRCAGPLPSEVSILDPVLHGRFLCHACAEALRDGKMTRIPRELPPVTPEAGVRHVADTSLAARAAEFESLPHSDLALRAAELEELVSSVQAFWRGEIKKARTRHRAELEQRDVKLALLRRELKDYRDRATRRPDGAPTPRQVRKAWREAWKATGSLKAAEAQLQEEHGWNPRMVQRVIAETDAEIAESMGITVARLREIEGRPPPRQESSDA